MNLRGYRGFQFLKGNESKECKFIAAMCSLEKVPFIFVDENEDYTGEYVPSGSVEWCLSLLGKEIKPDYYPSWLENHLHRNIWIENGCPENKDCFLKPVDKYKRFNGIKLYYGYILDSGSSNLHVCPPFICSDIVHFINEWRYYISNGQVLCGEWYSGDDEEDPSFDIPDAPELNVDIPAGWCGTLDFATLDTGEFALVEAHHPFACGWYGKDHKLYTQWCIDGWEYMIKRS